MGDPYASSTDQHRPEVDTYESSLYSVPMSTDDTPAAAEIAESRMDDADVLKVVRRVSHLTQADVDAIAVTPKGDVQAVVTAWNRCQHLGVAARAIRKLEAGQPLTRLEARWASARRVPPNVRRDLDILQAQVWDETHVGVFGAFVKNSGLVGRGGCALVDAPHFEKRQEEWMTAEKAAVNAAMALLNRQYCPDGFLDPLLQQWERAGL